MNYDWNTRKEVVEGFFVGNRHSELRRGYRQHPGLWEQVWKEFIEHFLKYEFINPAIIDQLAEPPNL